MSVRYKIGEVPTDMVAMDVSIFSGLALFTIIMGIGFFVAGRYGGQLWMQIWGVMLSMVSVMFYATLQYGWTLPGFST